MTNSVFGSLNVRDVVNGFLIAFLASALTTLVEVLQGGEFPTVDQLKKIGLVGLTAGLSYLVKNIFSNSQGQVFTKEETQA